MDPFLLEWCSNFNLGTGDEVLGFSRAAQEAYELTKAEVDKYLAGKDFSRVCYWVMGHSRGSAVGNLLSEKLTEDVGQDNVYFYGFATPSVSKKTRSYENLRNYIFQEDFFASLPPTLWGFGRHGQVIPMSVNDEKVARYFEQIEKGKPNYLTLEEAENLGKDFLAMVGGSQEGYYKNRGTEEP